MGLTVSNLSTQTQNMFCLAETPGTKHAWDIHPDKIIDMKADLILSQ
jgi:hypothetical protein